MRTVPEKVRLVGQQATGKVWIGTDIENRRSKLLDVEPSLRIRNHSPTGFSWGYRGSGPAQLALAILLRYLPRRLALDWYHQFKEQFITQLPQDDFEAVIDLGPWVRRKIVEQNAASRGECA